MQRIIHYASTLLASVILMTITYSSHIIGENTKELCNKTHNLACEILL